jgi:4-carboxymuconolactone decarboxylase
MARLPGVSAADAPAEVARVYEAATMRFGKLVEPLTISAHNLDIFRAYVAFEQRFAAAHHLDARLKELASLKTAALIGCPFCIDIGSAEARAAGVSESELRALATYRESAEFSALDKAVLDYATCMTRTPVTVPDELFARLAEELSPPALVELTATIAWESFRSRFNHALGIQAQGFSEGAYCVRPEAATT